MIKEVVWTPIKDNGKDIKTSPIWNECYRDDEMTAEINKLHREWYVYTVKFDGLKPTQITKFKKQKAWM